MTRFAQQQARESTHHIILATHRHVTIDQSRTLLRKWDKWVNRQILGRKGSNKHHIHCEWVAFPEHIQSDPHWHLLWRMSRSLDETRANNVLNGLTHGLDWIVHRHWKRAICSGTSKVVPIFEPERLGYYVTKEQRKSVAYDNMITSGEFKTDLLRAA